MLPINQLKGKPPNAVCPILHRRTFKFARKSRKTKGEGKKKEFNAE